MLLAVNIDHVYIVSTSCTRSHRATTKQNVILNFEKKNDHKQRLCCTPLVNEVMIKIGKHCNYLYDPMFSDR